MPAMVAALCIFSWAWVLAQARLAIDGLGEVVPDQLGSVQGHAVGEVVGVDGDVSLK